MSDKRKPLASVLAAALLVGTCGVSAPALHSLNRAPHSSSPHVQKAHTDFALKDGDRVVFFGDSITEQRLYTTYVEQYVLTHYPDRRITFINTGWGGDKVTSNDCKPCAGVGGLARIKRDVIDYRPTVVTLLFGMNDGLYQDFDPATLKVYEDGLTAIIRELKSKTTARIFVMTPTVYDGTRHTPWSHTDKYNDVLDRYSEAANAIARRESLPVIDLHAVTTDALARAKKEDPAYTFLPDGVHPEADGQLVMAAEMLRAWGAPPHGVELARTATLEGGQAVLTVFAPVPWPQPLPSEKLAKVSPQINELGAVGVRITGLAAGKYKLTIDGKNAGVYAAESLAGGVRIGESSDAAAEESKSISSLIRKRADFFYTGWRQVVLPLAPEYDGAAKMLASLSALSAEMQERTRMRAGFHKYQLIISRAE
jgi:lysophospholipase L1-like esterase